MALAWSTPPPLKQGIPFYCGPRRKNVQSFTDFQLVYELFLKLQINVLINGPREWRCGWGNIFIKTTSNWIWPEEPRRKRTNRTVERCDRSGGQQAEEEPNNKLELKEMGWLFEISVSRILLHTSTQISSSPHPGLSSSQIPIVVHSKIDCLTWVACLGLNSDWQWEDGMRWGWWEMSGCFELDWEMRMACHFICLKYEWRRS